MAERRSRVVILLEAFFGAVAILVGPIPALITAAIALDTFKYRSFHSYDHITLEDITVDYEFRDQLYTAIGMAITVSSLAIIVKISLILLHLLTIFYNVVNVKTKMLCLSDIMASFVLARGHLVSGILLVTFDTFEDMDDFEYYNVYSTIKLLRNTMIASGTFCFVSTLLFIGVAIFMLICFVMNDWIWTSAFNQTLQTEAEPNELDEQELHVNEERISLIA